MTIAGPSSSSAIVPGTKFERKTKMNKVLILMFAMIALAVVAFGADNTLGSWKYNASESKLPPGMSPITNLVLKREGVDGGAKISAKEDRADGSKLDTTTTVKYDGKKVVVTGTGLRWNTTAIRQIDANTLAEERWMTGTKYHSKVRTVVSADGKRTTSTAVGTGADGKPFTAIIVFDKQ